MSNRAVQLTISILLVVSVLCCSFSVYADDEDEPLTGGNPYLDYDFDQIAFLIWQLLSSWGIDVTYNDISSFTSPVQETIQQWIYEYLDTQPSVESVASWVVDWMFDTDIWGNLVVNHSLMDDVRSFANWLQGKYPLTNNASVVVNPEYQLNNLKVYRMNIFWYAYYDNVTNMYEYRQFTVDADVYVVFSVGETEGRQVLSAIPFKANSNSIDVGYYVNGNWQLTRNVTFSRPKRGMWYWDVMPMGQLYDAVYNDGVTSLPYHVYDSDAVRDAMNESNTIRQDGDIYILTTEVIVPEVNVDYGSDDGMVIIDGRPNYQEITFPDSVAVNNLPAIVSTRDIDNPHMEEAYQPVQGLIEMTKDGVELMHGIVNELPGEAVTCIYALIGAMIVFGMIKLMREH